MPVIPSERSMVRLAAAAGTAARCPALGVRERSPAHGRGGVFLCCTGRYSHTSPLRSTWSGVIEHSSPGRHRTPVVVSPCRPTRAPGTATWRPRRLLHAVTVFPPGRRVATSQRLDGFQGMDDRALNQFLLDCPTEHAHHTLHALVDVSTGEAGVDERLPHHLEFLWRELTRRQVRVQFTHQCGWSAASDGIGRLRDSP